MKRLNAETLDARLNGPDPGQKMPRRNKQIAPVFGKALDEPHFWAEEVEIELGESEEWDKASEQEEKSE